MDTSTYVKGGKRMDYRKMSKEELVNLLEVMERTATPPIKEVDDVVERLREYAGKKREHFLAVLLDGSNQVISVEVVAIGLANKCIVHPREVFAPAIAKRAVSIITAHNHPSGGLDPSEEDKNVALRLEEAGRLLGIPQLDHIIISPKGHYSFLEAGLISGRER